MLDQRDRPPRRPEEPSQGGTQSIERAIALLMLVGRAGPAGARLSDLVAEADLPKPTVRRVLLALVKAGLLEQEEASRRYHLGSETYVLGTLASQRFGIHALSLDGLARIAKESGDCAFLSVARGTFSVCLHREEGSFPIRTHVLLAGDRHPLGVGAAGLAMLAALPDEEVERVLAANAEVMAQRYPMFTADIFREGVADTRRRGYAFNPGLYVSGSWGLGVPVLGLNGEPVGALSIAAIDSRLKEERHGLLVPLLKREAKILQEALRRPQSAIGRQGQSTPARGGSRPTQKVKP